MVQDLHFVLRQLIRQPLFTVVAVLSLALGAGVNSTLFSLIDGLYLRPLAVAEPDRLLRVFLTSPERSEELLSYVEYEDLRREAASYSGVACLMRRGAEYRQDGRLSLMMVNVTSPDFFQVLGVRPHRGRLYGPGQEESNAAVLGYNTWRRVFGADETIVGRSIRLTMGQVTIVGVLPPEFRDTSVQGDRDFWVPPATWRAMVKGGVQDFTARRHRIFETFARLRPGATLESARGEAASISRRWQDTAAAADQNMALLPMSDFAWRWKNHGPAVSALFGIVGLVVFAACINIANLLLARAEARRREVAVRASLGAGRWPVARLFLLESAVLGVLGLATGTLLGAWLIQVLPALLIPVPGFPIREVFQLDSRVLLATALASLFTLFAVGLAPLGTVLRAHLVDSLRGQGGTTRRAPLRNWLTAAQVALSVVLLAGAGVLAASLWQTRTADLGMTRSNPMVVWSVGVGETKLREACQRVRELPGVARMAVAMRAPMSLSGSGMRRPVSSPGHSDLTAARPVEIRYNTIDENFLGLMGLRVLSGRGFEPADMTGGEPTVLINETMAKRFWPSGNPVGKYLAVSNNEGPVWRIAGVVNDAPINSVTETPEPYFYMPYWRTTRWDLTLLIEPRGDRDTLARAVRQVLAGADRDLEPELIIGLEELMRYSARQNALLAQLSGALAGLGLLLTAVGLYGVLAYNVTRRRREIGIRMALGSDRRQTTQLILGQSLRLVAWGIAAGLPFALAATRQLQSVLFRVEPWHPAVFAGALILLAGSAILAAAGPAGRAARIDPASVLRDE
jgi:predicted permease